MKQPLAGSLATLSVIVVSLGFIASLPVDILVGWVGFFLVCSVTIQSLLGIAWKMSLPRSLAAMRQPLKGVLFTLLTIVLGAAVTAVLYALMGQGVSPPSPMITHYAILCVILSFLMTIIWGGWPFTAMFQSDFGKGVSLFFGYFVVGYVLFHWLFNYAFLQGTPVYVAASDPHGMLMGWIPLTLCICTAIGMFVMLSFDLWPLYKFPQLMKQPVLGIVWSLIAMAVSATIYCVGTYLMHVDTVVLMTRGAVPFVFGFIVVLFMLQGGPFAKLAQPLKGILTVPFSMMLGYLLSLGYLALAPSLSGPLPSGPPTYDLEIWNATALLGVTFPILTVSSSYFDFWPFMAPPAHQETPEKKASAAGHAQQA